MVGENKFLLMGLGIGALVLVYLVAKPGAAAATGQAVGTAAVDAAAGAVDGVTTGVVSGVSDIVGIPEPSQTITDADQCKAYMDANGVWSASTHCSAPAFFEAMTM